MEMQQRTYATQVSGGPDDGNTAVDMSETQAMCNRLADASDKAIERSLSGVDVEAFLRSTGQMRGAQ